MDYQWIRLECSLKVVLTSSDDFSFSCDLVKNINFEICFRYMFKTDAAGAPYNQNVI